MGAGRDGSWGADLAVAMGARATGEGAASCGGKLSRAGFAQPAGEPVMTKRTELFWNPISESLVWKAKRTFGDSRTYIWSSNEGSRPRTNEPLLKEIGWVEL